MNLCVPLKPRAVGDANIYKMLCPGRHNIPGPSPASLSKEVLCWSLFNRHLSFNFSSAWQSLGDLGQVTCLPPYSLALYLQREKKMLPTALVVLAHASGNPLERSPRKIFCIQANVHCFVLGDFLS